MNQQQPNLARQSHWEWPEATRGQRLMAFVLDNLILTAIAALAGAIGDHISNFGALGGLFRFIVTVGYYPFFHIRTGQSIGKMIIGIQVLALDGQRASAGTIWKREMWGRFCCTALLGAGYIAILFRKDKRGWHDVISGTHVVALQEAKEIRFATVFASIFALVVAAGGGIYYAFNYTSLPVQGVAKQLERYGCRVGEVGGSLKKGYTIESLKCEQDGNSIETSKIAFKVKDFGSKKGIAIGDISVSHASVTMKEMPGKSGPQHKKAETPPPAAAVAAAPAAAKASGGPVTIDSLNVDHFEFHAPNGKTYNIKRFYISDFVANEKDKSVQLGRVWIESDALDLSMQDIFLTKEKMRITKQGYLALKPALFPEYIRGTIDVRGDINYEKGDWDANLNAFNNRLQVGFTGGVATIKAFGLNPKDYFVTDLPVQNLNLNVGFQPKVFALQMNGGSLQLRNTLFTLTKTGNFEFARPGDQKYVLEPQLGKWMQIFKNGQPPFILMSEKAEPATECMAALYFGKSFSALNPIETAEIAKDARYIGSVNQLRNQLGGGTPIPVGTARLPATATPLVPQSPVQMGNRPLTTTLPSAEGIAP